MDFVLNVFKHIAQIVSPSELLLIICAVAALAFMIARFMIGVSGKKGAFGGLMGGDAEAIKKDKMHQLLQDKLANLLVKEDFSQAMEKLQEEILDTIHTINRDQSSKIADIHHKVQTIAEIKKEIDTSMNIIQDDIRAIRHQLTTHDNADERNFGAVKEYLQRSQDSLNRLMLQVEKVDEFARAMVPEFRGHHKDLNSAVAAVSKDIALVERSIQTQINTTNAVKLR